jgi:hypothetical protein
MEIDTVTDQEEAERWAAGERDPFNLTPANETARPPAGHGGAEEAARAEGRGAPPEFTAALASLRARQAASQRRIGLSSSEPPAPSSTKQVDFGGGAGMDRRPTTGHEGPRMNQLLGALFGRPRRR